MSAFLILMGALILDRLFGDPRRFHPLAGFGRLAAWAESRWHAPSRLRGALLLAALVLPWVALAALGASLAWGWLLSLAILTLAIGWRSLDEHAEVVARALETDDLHGARTGVGMLVSRDTEALDVRGVSGATIESVLENGNDALFATIFWFLVAGAPGVVAYRLVNTLDAMWGYRNERYATFGWAAARLDDAMNLIPARLTALAYALAGRGRDALQCWREQAAGWKSPNAGPVMAAGAGALGVVLGGPAPYGGQREWRPRLGMGRLADAAGIRQAVALVDRALAIWMAFIVMGVIVVVLF
ncbi:MULTISPECIES: adenosylcobinamide-phosphate synthase CbiB [unclassified Thioalkalivibrio]|uniref:adenosylcobinamide-phosphate synthase CbiB n=1 Tax=unclassified Thioalkalivibrio TaxID=2621013 RepID=UPI00036C48C5|nr:MULTISPECIES: adenosylcobinamide-phosphate synthase CbiB [unclassified Thioalkalivibrio]